MTRSECCSRPVCYPVRTRHPNRVKKSTFSTCACPWGAFWPITSSGLIGCRKVPMRIADRICILKSVMHRSDLSLAWTLRTAPASRAAACPSDHTTRLRPELPFPHCTLLGILSSRWRRRSRLWDCCERSDTPSALPTQLLRFRLVHRDHRDQYTVREVAQRPPR